MPGESTTRELRLLVQRATTFLEIDEARASPERLAEERG
jgi:hypothetical protein